MTVTDVRNVINKNMKDQPHLDLVADLALLLKEASDGEFHDFANEKYAAPKMELERKLSIIRDNVINGKYDNPTTR